MSGVVDGNGTHEGGDDPDSPAPTVVLASASPRRARLLETIGLDPVIIAAEVDETAGPDEAAADLVERLALAKLRAGYQRYRDAGAMVEPAAGVLVIAADTVVVVHDSILGKPRGEADAVRLLSALSGTRHQVLTGVAVGRAGGSAVDGHLDTVESTVETTTVTMRTLDHDLIAWYVATGEPLDKAGGYGIQGRGGLLVDGIEGCQPNVVGLPLTALDRLSARLGWPLHRLATSAAGTAATTPESDVVGAG